MENEQEIWKTYPDYDFIEVSNLGRVRSIDHWVTYKNRSRRLYKGHILRQYQNQDGYMYVQFGVNGKSVHLRVSRAVATCFVSNPNNYPEVNHIDCDRTNNRWGNLEWCTHQENIAYRDKLGHGVSNSPRRPVFAVDLETGKVLWFETQSEAARQLGISVASVNMVVRGKLNGTHGYWFTEDENEITEEKIQEIRAKISFLGGVIAVNPETAEVFRFKSQHDAARQLGVYVGNVNKVIKGRLNKTGGYWFTNADSTAVEKTRSKFGDELADKVERLLQEHL